jgi:hypothetical protein
MADATPVDPSTLGYGTDLSCTSDLAEDMRSVAPNSAEGIAQQALRGLDCPPGRLIDDPTWGIDLASRLNRPQTVHELQATEALVRAQIETDDRVGSCTVSVTLSGAARSVKASVVVRIVPADPALAPFTLVFVVTDGALALQEMAS